MQFCADDRARMLRQRLPEPPKAFCDGQSPASLRKCSEAVAVAPLRGGSMPVFQRLFFETQQSELPADPAIRANIWADRFREIITSMDVDFLAGDATLFGRHNLLSNGTVVIGEMLSSSFKGMRANHQARVLIVGLLLCLSATSNAATSSQLRARGKV